jgi:hypothetical protein
MTTRDSACGCRRTQVVHWRTPEAVRAALRLRYLRHAGTWSLGEGKWPLRIPLGIPTQMQARAQWDLFESWVAQWWGVANVEFVERRWPTLGAQRIPEHVCFDTAHSVAQALGEDEAFSRAQSRARALVERRPELRVALRTQFEDLCGIGDRDFERLTTVFDWLRAHPESNLYQRQLPIAGIDSKWLEGAPQRILRAWLRAHAAADEGLDFLALAGLRPLPDRVHLRVLDAGLRIGLGGLGDVIAPIEDLVRLTLPGLRCVYVVENLQTGLAFGDLPGCVLIIGRGYAVDVLKRLPWLRDRPLIYWGDIDTHGFAILDRLRRHFPRARSLLMDVTTLMRHRAVWGEEPRPHTAERLPALTDTEAELYADLRRGRWTLHLRLEQERIDWGYAWSRILAAAVDDCVACINVNGAPNADA